MAGYSKGFKRRVVQLWIQHGMSTNEISRTSGIDHKTLMRWYKRFYPEITGEGTEKVDYTVYIWYNVSIKYRRCFYDRTTAEIDAKSIHGNI